MANNENGEKSKPVIDIDSLNLDDNELMIDPSADPDVRMVPPEGKYLVKLALNKSNGSGVTQGKDRRGRSYLMVQLLGTIVAEGKPV